MPFSLLKAFFGNYAISRSPLDSSSGDSTHSTGDTGTRAAAVSRHYRVTARNKHNHSRPHSQLYQVLLSLFTLTLELSTNLRESFCNVVQSGEGPCWNAYWQLYGSLFTKLIACRSSNLQTSVKCLIVSQVCKRSYQISAFSEYCEKLVDRSIWYTPLYGHHQPHCPWTPGYQQWVAAAQLELDMLQPRASAVNTVLIDIKRRICTFVLWKAACV